MKQLTSKRDIHGLSRRDDFAIQVEGLMPVKVKVGAVLDWLERPGRTPEERDRKKYLQNLLGAERR